jgi:hypothetical protein
MVVAGHTTGTVTDDRYNSGLDLAVRRACVESVKLPARKTDRMKK